MTYFNIPGVYSNIDASAAVQSLSTNESVIGVVAKATTGLDNVAYAPSSFDDAKTVYGANSEVVKLIKTAMDNGGNKFIVVKVAQGLKETAEINITSGATAASNITITLNAVAVNVAVAVSDTPAIVATKIKAATFTGWTVTGTGTKVIFTSNTVGDKTDAEFSAGTTGVVASIVTTQQGSTPDDYVGALNVLELEEAVDIVITDSTNPTVHALVRAHCISASENRKERIAFIGYDASTSIATAQANVDVINSQYIYTAYPNVLDSSGVEQSGIYSAAALAGAVSAEIDPSMPMTDVELFGFYGLSKKLKDSEMSALIDSGIIPLESRNGAITIVRAISTYTKNAQDETDITWQELTTVRISHYVMKDMRGDLRNRFARAKQSGRTRDSIKVAVINRLKTYETLEYIENVKDTDVSIIINPSNPTRNDVDFKYDVVTPLNVINLTGHLVL